MLGYDPKEAAEFISERMDPKIVKKVHQNPQELIEKMILADLTFMVNSGVITEGGEQGHEEYDDDEAYESIYEDVLEQFDSDDEDLTIAAFLNEFMDCQYRFMESHGLVQ